MPCPGCKSDDFIWYGGEYECMACGFKWRTAAAKPVRGRAERVGVSGSPSLFLSEEWCNAVCGDGFWLLPHIHIH